MRKLNQKGISHHLLLIAIAALVVGAAGFAGWRVYQGRQLDAQAQTLKGNQIIATAQKYLGYRYGNQENITKHSQIWGVNIDPVGSFGGDPVAWLAVNDGSASNNSSRTNFLDCSGYVSVVMYKAFGYRASSRLTSSSFSKGKSVAGFTEIRDLKTLRAGDIIHKSGHIAIFSNYADAAKTKVNYYDASTDNTRTALRANKSLSGFDTAFRYN